MVFVGGRGGFPHIFTQLIFHSSVFWIWSRVDVEIGLACQSLAGGKKDGSFQGKGSLVSWWAKLSGLGIPTFRLAIIIPLPLLYPQRFGFFFLREGGWVFTCTGFPISNLTTGYLLTNEYWPPPSVPSVPAEKQMFSRKGFRSQDTILL